MPTLIASVDSQFATCADSVRLTHDDLFVGFTEKGMERNLGSGETKGIVKRELQLVR